MRTLLAIGIVMGGILTLNLPADAARKAKRIEAKRIAKPSGFSLSGLPMKLVHPVNEDGEAIGFAKLLVKPNSSRA
jgi:hypothetical protein